MSAFNDHDEAEAVSTAVESRRRADTGRLVALATVLGAVGLMLVLLVDVTVTGLGADRPAVVVGAGVLLLFVLAESSQFHVEVRKQAFSVSVSDLPLVIGLFLLPPWWLLAVRLLSAVLVFVVRRTAAAKVGFNLGLFVAEVGIASALFHALDPGDGTSGRDWAVAFGVILVVDVVSGVSVIVAMRALDAPPAVDEMARMVLSVVVSGALTTTLALMALVVLVTTSSGIWLLVVLAVVVALAHRAYYRLLRRHADLGQLLVFTQAVGAADTTDEVVSTLLQQARELLQAESALLRLPTTDTGADTPDWFAEPMIVPRGTRDPALRAWLGSVKLHDALIVPLRDDEALLGVIQVGNRLGEASTFGRDDLHLLQTLVAHAEVLWRNGRLLEQLRHDAAHDGLTGLGNRSHFRSELDKHLPGLYSVGPVDDDERAAVLLLDLDRFKEVNDTLGHPVGGELLRSVAQRICEHVPPAAVVTRLGGDEFAVLLPHTPPGDTGLEVATRIRQGLTDPFEVQGISLEVGASIGVAAIPADGRDASTLLQHADVAMYVAKTQSHGVARYQPDDDRSSMDRLAMVGDLRRALHDGDVTMYLQPQNRLSTGEVVCWEALARWDHPSRGRVMPDEFIPLAERTGLISLLTHVALAQSLAHCSAWLADSPDVGVAVNLAPRQLLDPELPSTVSSMLRSSAVPARLLTLEITETSIMTDPGAAAAALATLRELGVRLSIDDFGTGHSALAYLQRLPLDEVKIDKSFTMAMTTDPSARAIVRAIIDLAHTLGLSVVAEGVEDVPTRTLLLEYGCDVMQGYLLSRPMPAVEVSGWMAEQDAARRAKS